MRVSVIEFYRSSIGKKIVMALTGLLLVGFLVGHMVGNLKAFGGVDPLTGMHKLDAYALFLREIGEKMLGHGGFLWLSRIVLLGAVLLHITAAVQLAAMNRRARGRSYETQRFSSATLASRGMLVGGVVLLVFIIFHILHFTTGTLHFRGFVEGNVFENVVRGFQSFPVLVFYLIALGAVALHVYHGGWSLLQTLGLDSPYLNSSVRRGVRVLAVLLFVGFSSVPLGVATGVLSLSRLSLTDQSLNIGSESGVALNGEHDLLEEQGDLVPHENFKGAADSADSSASSSTAETLMDEDAPTALAGGAGANDDEF